MGAERRGLELFLKRLLLRSVLTDEEQQAILDLPGKSTQVGANRDFVRLGEVVDRACLLVDGLVGRFAQTRTGNRQIIALHLPGDMADLHSVVAPRSSLPLQALTHSTIFRIPHTALIALSDRYPAIARAFWRDGIVDASIVSQSLLSMGRRKAASRLAHLYCEMAMRSELLGYARHAPFPFEASQQQIADILGLTQVHVNRTLQTLRESGLVDVSRKQVHVLDWNGLADLAEFDPLYLQLEPIDLHADGG